MLERVGTAASEHPCAPNFGTTGRQRLLVHHLLSPLPPPPTLPPHFNPYLALPNSTTGESEIAGSSLIDKNTRPSPTRRDGFGSERGKRLNQLVGLPYIRGLLTFPSWKSSCKHFNVSLLDTSAPPHLQHPSTTTTTTTIPRFQPHAC